MSEQQRQQWIRGHPWHFTRILPTPAFYYLLDHWKIRSLNMWSPFYFVCYLNIYIVYACGCAQGACVYGLNVYDMHAWV